MNALDPVAIQEALEPLSLRVDRQEITLVGVRLDDEACYVVVRLITWDEDGVRDIKEQEVFGPAPLFVDLERLRAFALGHAEALRQALKAVGTKDEYLMPHDLLHFRVLELARPRTPEEFTAALMTKKRLGKLLS